MIQTGLTEREVIESRTKHGTNALTEKKRKGFLKRYLEAFSDPIVKILVGALILNLAISYRNVNWFEIGGIVCAVLFSTLVSTLSESGSEAAFRRLTAHASEELCRARRSGQIVEIPVQELVVGDIVLLESGDRTPADGMLVSGEVTVDQSALNGESAEVKKRASGQPSSDGKSVLERENTVGRGSLVIAGAAEMRVTAVGDATYYGRAASELQSETRPSPLKHRLSMLASSISFIGYVAAGMVAFAYLFYAFFIEAGMNPVEIRARFTDLRFVLSELLHALTMAVSILVVAVPEGLPMMITVVLSSNTKRMLRDHVIVRKLVGIETAGSLNILFTDKTGTLTEGRMKAKEWIFGTGDRCTASDIRRMSKIKNVIAAAAILNNSATLSPAGEPIGTNATDRAILDWARQLPRENLPAVKERIPFDSATKHSAVTVSGLRTGESTVLIKGAPEYLLPHVTAYMDRDGNTHPADTRFFAEVRARQHELATKAYRILAFVLKENSNAPSLTDNLVFLGFLCLRDRVRREAASAIAEVHNAGVQVVMITGDNPATAQAVAEECGIRTGSWREVITGAELRAMSDEEVKTKIPHLSVVARAVPTDKTRLVRLSQELGLVAGMTGDGVNDAPALKCADVGFSMGSGTEVAREAGDIVISDNNFASISRAILYGRTIFDSIRKFILFQLTMNLSAVGICLIGPFIGIEEPVTVTQMLWVNMIMDTLGGLAFSGEPPLREYMRQPPKSRDEKLITGKILNQILLSGLFTIGLCIWFLKSPTVGYALSLPGEAYRLSAFFAMFIFCGIFISFNSRTPRINLLAHLAGNRPFILIMLLISGLQLLFIYFGGDAFRAVPLRLPDLLYSICLAATVIPADLLRKMIVRRLHKTKNRSHSAGVVSTSSMSS